MRHYYLFLPKLLAWQQNLDIPIQSTEKAKKNRAPEKSRKAIKEDTREELAAVAEKTEKMPKPGEWKSVDFSTFERMFTYNQFAKQFKVCIRDFVGWGDIHSIPISITNFVSGWTKEGVEFKDGLAEITLERKGEKVTVILQILGSDDNKGKIEEGGSLPWRMQASLFNLHGQRIVGPISNVDRWKEKKDPYIYNAIGHRGANLKQQFEEAVKKDLKQFQ